MEILEKTCPYCPKVIQGTTLNQVEHLLNIHVVCKHANKVKITEIDKNG